MSTLGERIKQLRLEHGMTQEEFGKLFGVTKYSISLYESNKTSPSDEIKKKIAEYFNVSMDWLMGLTDVRKPFIPENYKEKYKITKRDMLQYENFIQHVNAFFMDDKVAEEDKEKLFRDISELFWKAKEINKEKYGRKKKKEKTD
ncbi:transcriptional regulator with XRE-family HTH domain [Caldanaerobacter subterraneus subsp. tengcongensis MB4]|uniref:Predicted Transcriptional regulator n=2 Tax=Thermoanaerobacteraceae TaxID=186814 RepID=Q8R5Q6_CALS4|nr:MULTISPECIES: helix-turn-helix transcriptional regulator [Thermoanaerobacteraceae]AAM25290.1 predicted Transcriptional regulator [Caldanaerobacter subterraneus subsp. tengcongensis MB4]MCS3915110.1 transcriptional regulator with XRE-family HTH domain [Caldanaerobacter subterraneus subsp. tengcongensis MB4]MDP9750382.1 transcriptional regulator with XRE-family HTH domain [Thermoanaerobacter pentosaceus]